jgi:uncharacterized repeat protein (TIGR02543 family)
MGECKMTEKKLSLMRLAAVLLSALMIVSFVPILSDQKAYAGSDSNMQAYAVLEDGTLYFIRSTSGPSGTGTEQTITDVDNKTYTGKVYTGFEDVDYKDAESVPWHDDKDEITQISCGKIGYGKNCSPISTAHWFEGCSKIKSVDFYYYLTGINTENITNASCMFRDCKSLQSVRILSLSSVTDVSSMFEGCSKLETVKFRSDKIQNASNMFEGCSELKTANLEGSEFQNASSMFEGCSELETVSLNDDEIQNANSMFKGCSSLKRLYISLHNATDISNIFNGCTSLYKYSSELNPSLTQMSGAFKGCTSLKCCILKFNGNSSTRDMSHMFEGCSNLGQSDLELENITIGENCNTTAMFNGAASANKEGIYWDGVTSSKAAADIINDATKTGIDTSRLRFTFTHHVIFHGCDYDDDDEMECPHNCDVQIRDGYSIRDAQYDGIQGERQYYDFYGWYTDAELTHPFNINTPVTEDMDLYAKWIKAGSSNDHEKDDQTKPGTGNEDGKTDLQDKEYKIIFDSNGGSTVTSQKLKAGSKVQRPADPERKGYVFSGWYTDSSLMNAYDFSTSIDSDMTLYAKWTAKSEIVSGRGLLKLRVSTKGNSQILKWGKIKGADGYDVYFAKYGSRFKKVRTTKSLSLTRRGLERGKEYGCYVNAFRYSNGKKVYITTSLACYSIAGGYGRTKTNARKIAVSPKSVVLEQGGKMTVAPRTVKMRKGLRLISKSHCPVYRYQSSNTKVASVRNGVITGKRTGTCTVYVFAQNGVRTSVKVKVE